MTTKDVEQLRSAALESILAKLNTNQLDAVTADPTVPLQIIAGPGTGKTSVLTSRVLYLLLKHKYEPQKIIVTTFTRKAAKEMTERLQAMVPPELGISVSSLIIGTFHSICVRLLRQNGSSIGVAQNFKVVDDRDSKEVLTRILNNPSRELLDLLSHLEQARKTNESSFTDVNIFQENQDKCNGYDVDKVKRHISSLKSSGISHEEYGNNSKRSLELGQIYHEYQQTLSRSNYIDFDDILLLTKKLLDAKVCLSYVKHVLVDEFQDTDAVQLQLLYSFSGQSTQYPNSVTIVGDPDQSIYAFRNAVSKNFEYMRLHYKAKNDIKVVLLDQNYRSVNSVLKISEELMRQEVQTDRQQKNLKSKFANEFKVAYNRFETNSDEAEFIATEIASLSKFPGLYKHDEFAILIRSRFHSRVIEQALRRNTIAYKVVQGKAFWELKEIQTIIDYLRCITSEMDKLPLLRVINVPPRGIGTKALENLAQLIDSHIADSGQDCSVLEFLRQLSPKSKDNRGGLNVATCKGVLNFLDTLAEAKSILLSSSDVGEGIHKMFDYLVEQTNLIERTRPDDPTTTENNLKEFKRELLEFEIIDRSLPDPETGEYSDFTPASPNRDGLSLLSDFIESMDLYETDSSEDDKVNSKPKVVISTIHGAKGLEWPVVFIPALTESFFPATWALKTDLKGSKAAELQQALLNEERRALYVAMTRAKTSLYLSGFKTKLFSDQELEESRFLKTLKDHCSDRNDGVSSLKNLTKFFELNGKPFPSRVEEKKLANLVRSYNDYHDLYKPETEGKQGKGTSRGSGGFTNATSILGILSSFGGNKSFKRKFSQTEPKYSNPNGFKRIIGQPTKISTQPTFRRIIGQPTKVSNQPAFKKFTAPLKKAPFSSNSPTKAPLPSSIKKSFAPTYTYNKKEFK